MVKFIDSMLDEMEKVHKSFTVEHDGFMYVIRMRDARNFTVCKLVDDTAVNYKLRLHCDSWLCSCPAGLRGRVCKHSIWVDLLAKACRRGAVIKGLNG